jgi:pimeloyl-ACP methyl ester carboxylesterase
MRKILAVLACLTFVACRPGQPPPADPAQAFFDQQVRWQSCDDQLFSDFIEAFEPIAERLECTRLKTPLSWQDPARETVDLGVLRVRAGDPDNRQGAILLNPGGPGGDGLLIGAFLGLAFATADEGTPAAAELAALSAQYDIIGFSPRGVGESFQLTCGSNRLVKVAPKLYDTSEDNLNDTLLLAELLADACERNPLAKYIDTEQTARDMELIRVVLGDDKLNYLGYSYGSWLGAWYAKLFPETTGHMVLDANTEFSATFQDSFGLQPLGFDRAFRDIAAAYIARNSAIYALGDSGDAVYATFLNLPELVREQFTTGSLGAAFNLYSADAIPDLGFKLMAADAFVTILAAVGEPSEPGQLLTAIDVFTFSPIEAVDELVRAYATELAFGYLASLSPGESTIFLPPEGAVFRAIQCNDSPWSKDPAFHKQRGRDNASDFPFLGVFRTLEPCAFWGEPTTAMPEVPDNMPPILMVQTEFDAATPTEGALRAFESLPNASLLFVNNEVSHTAFPYFDDCVDVPVARYLLDGTLPDAAVTSCEARPLPGESQVFPPDTPVRPESIIAFSLQSALSPTSGNTIYDTLHRLIRESAAKAYGHRQIE